MSISPKLCASALEVLLALPAAAQAPAGGSLTSSRRGQVQDERAAAMEAFLGVLFPGTRVDWETESVVWPDGARQRVELTGFQRVAFGAGHVSLAGVQSPGPLEAALGKLRRRERVNAGSATCRLVVLRWDAAGQPAGQRSVPIDPEAPFARCRRLSVVPADEQPGPDAWPLVMADVETAVDGEGWAGSVAWQGVLDSGSGTWRNRVPHAIRRWPAGGGETTELLRVNRLDDGRMQFEVVGDTRRAAYPCADPQTCQVPPRALTDLLR
jgi:hypothetical protein